MFSDFDGGTLMHLTLFSLDTEWTTSEFPLPLVPFDQFCDVIPTFPAIDHGRNA